MRKPSHHVTCTSYSDNRVYVNGELRNKSWIIARQFTSQVTFSRSRDITIYSANRIFWLDFYTWDSIGCNITLFAIQYFRKCLRCWDKTIYNKRLTASFIPYLNVIPSVKHRDQRRIRSVWTGSGNRYLNNFRLIYNFYIWQEYIPFRQWTTPSNSEVSIWCIILFEIRGK